MYDMGTACQECKVLRAYSWIDLETAINNLLLDDWRMKGDIIIEQVINGTTGGSSGATRYSGMNGNDSISYELPSPMSMFTSTQIAYIQVMIR